jgi:hypothetical protein
MRFRKFVQAVLVVHERSSRLLRLTPQPNKAAQPVVENILLRPFALLLTSVPYLRQRYRVRCA